MSKANAVGPTSIKGSFFQLYQFTGKTFFIVEKNLTQFYTLTELVHSQLFESVSEALMVLHTSSTSAH